jgi:hypothetical protein
MVARPGASAAGRECHARPAMSRRPVSVRGCQRTSYRSMMSTKAQSTSVGKLALLRFFLKLSNPALHFSGVGEDRLGNMLAVFD